MSDLISRQAAIATAISGRVRTLPTTEVGEDWIRVSEVRESLYAVPSIDAVPVIRCKDCKYWHREIYNGIEYFNLSSCDLNHHGDGRNFYCADAERKEE